MKKQIIKNKLKLFYIISIIFCFLILPLNSSICSNEIKAANISKNPSPPARTKIIVGGSFDFPPYSFIDENGYPSGFASDLTREIAKFLDADVEFRLDKWALALDNLKTKKIDCIQDIFYSRERDTIYDFSTSYIDVTYAIITKRRAAFDA